MWRSVLRYVEEVCLFVFAFVSVSDESCDLTPTCNLCVWWDKGWREVAEAWRVMHMTN